MKLFEPARIGTMELKNRLIMPAMGTLFGAVGGAVTPQLITYYARRAQGGAALVIVEVTGIDPLGVNTLRQPAAWDDSFIPGLRDLAQAIQSNGAKAALQLHHAGRRARPSVIGTQPVAPSPVADPVTHAVPRELTRDEIHALIEAFAQGARRTREAGYDAVEIHGTHGYLIAQFLSPETNRRTDEYGGDVTGRVRFAVEIVRRTRELVGPDFPIIFRITGTEFTDEGLGLEDSKSMAALVEQAGADAIHVSGGGASSREQTSAPVLIPKGHLIPFAEAIRSKVTVPVIAVGGIVSLGLANSILRDSKADFVAVGRALIADPDLPRKWAEGRERDVNKCIACNTCMDTLFSGRSLRCVMNPLVGREDVEESPASEPKRVLVFGSGPASLECARVAAVRGHHVRLVSPRPRIEGRWNWLIRPFVYHKTKAVRAAGAEIVLGRALDAGLLYESQPQVVVLEEDLTAVAIDIPGASSSPVCMADQILSGELTVTPDRSVVILGAGNAGCETAEFLLRRGVRPTLVESGVEFGDGFEVFHRTVLEKKLVDEGATILKQAQATAICDGAVTVALLGGEEHVLPADLVVMALPYSAEAHVPQWLPDRKLTVHVLKACQSPRDTCDRIEEGADLARKL